jgi:hypothetical protein
MSDQPQLIYLEPDDEITSLVRRVRAAEGRSVVIVAPGRSRATSSAVALRLLAQVATEESRTLKLVADAATRAVATEAGIAAFATVAEATSGSAAPDQPATTPRAPIHVVRGVPNAASLATADRAPSPVVRTGSADETLAVKLPPPPAREGLPPRGRRSGLPKWPWLAGLLVVFLAAGAALLPGASVRITPTTLAVEPKAYQVHLPIGDRQSSDLRVTRPGTATGQRVEQVAATGTVSFFNWNTVTVEVPKGTQVSVGGTVAFTTTERIVVPKGRFGPPYQPGQKSAGVAAVVPGTGGNVAAGTIDTIDNASVRTLLRGLPDNPNRLVTNAEATAGGLETPHTVIQQSDVDAVVAAIQADLAAQLAAALAGQPGRLYAAPLASEVPVVKVPAALVGTEDNPAFELTGTLSFNRPYVARADVDKAARADLLADATAAPPGTTVLPSSIAVQMGTATASGDEMTIQVSVRAAAAAAIDTAAVRDQLAGMTRDEARAALADKGHVEIELWPGWLDRLPRIPFRISVETVGPAPGASPSG